MSDHQIIGTKQKLKNLKSIIVKMQSQPSKQCLLQRQLKNLVKSEDDEVLKKKITSYRQQELNQQKKKQSILDLSQISLNDQNILNDEIRKQIVHITTKDYKQRKSIENQFLQKIMLSTPFIQKFQMSHTFMETQQFIQNLKLKQFKKNQVVYEEDSYGNTVYIVLSGMVECNIQKCEHLNLTYLNKQIFQTGQYLDQELSKHKRTETMTCITDAELLYVQGEDYQNQVQKQIQSEQFLFQDFLLKMPVFSSFNHYTIANLIRCKIDKTFKINQVIYQQGDETDYIYVIMSGDVKIIEAVEKDHQFNESELEICRNLKELKTQIVDLKKSQLNPLNRIWSSHTKSLKKFEVAILGKGSYFGHEEILQNQKRQNCAVCLSSQSQIICIPKDIFQAYYQSLGKNKDQKIDDIKIKIHKQKVLLSDQTFQQAQQLNISMLEQRNEQSNLQYNPADGPTLERTVSNYNKDISFRGMIQQPSENLNKPNSGQKLRPQTAVDFQEKIRKLKEEEKNIEFVKLKIFTPLTEKLQRIQDLQIRQKFQSTKPKQIKNIQQIIYRDESLDSLKKLQSQRMLKSLKIDRIFSAQLNDLKYSLKQQEQSYRYSPQILEFQQKNIIKQEFIEYKRDQVTYF